MNGNTVCHFFAIRVKCFAFWTRKATGDFYMGFVEGKHLNHPQLVAGDRSRMKILPIEPEGDLPVELIEDIIQHAIGLYKMGIIKTKK
jgi:hypothetical protein